MWTLCKSDLLLRSARSAKVASGPLLEVFDVSNLLQITFHHVCISRIDKDLLTISHSFQKLLVILLFLDYLFFGTKVFSLLANLLFEDIVDSELSQLLLQHQLVVLVTHVILHLLLAPL